MSGSGVNSEAELGQTASAPLAPSNLAALRFQHLHKVIEDVNWQNKYGPDFRDRFLAGQYRFHSGDDNARGPLIQPNSGCSSSMAVSFDTISFASSGTPGYPPSLSSYSTNSRESVRTSLADHFLELQFLPESPNGTPESPDGEREGGLECWLRFLACDFRSDDLSQWHTHCEAHFHRDLPPTLHCPFQCQWSRTAKIGEEAWQALTIHIWSEHRGDRAVDTNRRPQDALLQHLWRAQIIDNAQLKELRKNGRLSGPQVFMRSAGSNHDRRAERRRR